MPVSHTSRLSLLAAAARADEHAARPGVAERVGDQVAQDALDQHRVAEEIERWSARIRKRRPRSNASGSKSIRRRSSIGASSKWVGFALSTPESILEMSSSSLNRPSSASTEALMLFTTLQHLGVARLLGERRGEQAHRVQRLAQVVAGGGEELGLGAVRDLGVVPRALGDLASRARARRSASRACARAPRSRSGCEGCDQHAVVVAAEREERERRDADDERQREVCGLALDDVAHDDRHQRREHEDVERRQMHADEQHRRGGHGEDEHDQERLVDRRVGHEEEQRRETPQAAREERARSPSSSRRGRCRRARCRCAASGDTASSASPGSPPCRRTSPRSSSSARCPTSPPRGAAPRPSCRRSRSGSWL